MIGDDAHARNTATVISTSGFPINGLQHYHPRHRLQPRQYRDRQGRLSAASGDDHRNDLITGQGLFLDDDPGGIGESPGAGLVPDMASQTLVRTSPTPHDHPNAVPPDWVWTAA